MIQKETVLEVSDNSGAKRVRCIGVYRSRIAKIGTKILIAIEKFQPKSKITKKGEMFKAIVVRTRKPFLRKNGVSLKFKNNSVILINNNNELIGSKVTEKIPEEIKKLKIQKLHIQNSELC